MSVDLPAPFLPTNACTSPAATEKETSSSARTPGKSFTILSNSTTSLGAVPFIGSQTRCKGRGAHTAPRPDLACGRGRRLLAAHLLFDVAPQPLVIDIGFAD